MTTAVMPSHGVDDDAINRSGRPYGATTEHRGPRVKLFVSDEPTPCQSVDTDDIELWFGNAIEGRDLAVMACQACPFRGRCSYNAVAVRATHGVWGGIELPGDRARRLTPVYERLLRQFEERRQIEIGDIAVEPLAADEHFLRRHEPAA